MSRYDAEYLRSWLSQLLRFLTMVLSMIGRYARHRPKTFTLLTVPTLYALLYLWIRHLVWTDMGRWYWNYLVTFHPALAYILPQGSWGPIENPPRWLDPMVVAPWMGEWKIPHLTAPVYDYHSSHNSISGVEPRLISPVIVKLHVFSTPTAKSQSKRHLIRTVSPLLNIPYEYRHLVELKFVLGYALNDDGEVNVEMEDSLKEEQLAHNDLIRLKGLKNGENLREGKIFEWIRAAGTGRDGGREGWFLFKMDDDTVLNTANFLDTLLSLNPHDSYYLGTSLNRWPAYHFHFTGMITGYSWGVVKTLAAGIDGLREYDIQYPWDDDVLMGELMFTLPSAPNCRSPSVAHPAAFLPAYCDPHEPPPWGYLPPPPSPDPRTGLIRYDFVRRAGEPKLWWIKGDIGTHSWWLKFEDQYLKEWRKRVEGRMWKPPKWLEALAERSQDRELTHP